MIDTHKGCGLLLDHVIEGVLLKYHVILCVRRVEFTCQIKKKILGPIVGILEI